MARGHDFHFFDKEKSITTDSSMKDSPIIG